MKKYCGNGKPFLYGIFTPADREEALTVLEKLAGTGHEVWYGSGWDTAEQNKLKKAAGAVLFLTPASAADPGFREAAIRAARSGRPLLSVYLADTELDKGLSLELGDVQGIMKHTLPEEEFDRKLLSSPALERLEVTPEQKKAARNTLIAAAAGAAAAVVLVAVSMAGIIGGGRIGAGSLLDKLGLSGSVDSIRTVYLYGENLMDSYQFSGGLTRVTEESVAAGDDGQRIALAATGEEFPWGQLTDISDFSQLSNLEELCLAGNQVTDISPLKDLKKLRMLDLTGMSPVDITSLPEFPALEALNLSWCGFADDPENQYDDTMYERSLNALLGCAALRTVYVDSSMLRVNDGPEGRTGALAEAYAAGTLPFEVVVTDRSVSNWTELKAAAEDPDVHFITIVGDIDIPARETLTIRPGVSMQGVYRDVVNRGTVELYGVWEMGLNYRTNYGIIRVMPGGNYSGGMCDTVNYGTFVVEEGGTAVLERAHSYTVEGGAFQIDGLFLIPDGGGSLVWIGGQLVNNGRIACYRPQGAMYRDMHGVFDPAALPGTGSFEEFGSLPHDHSPQDVRPLPEPSEEPSSEPTGEPEPTPEPERSRVVTTWAELKEVSRDETLTKIVINREEPNDSLPELFLTIPAGETLTIRQGVELTGVNATVTNNGTVEVYGEWEMGMADRVNNGTIRVKNGGHYSGGMCGTINYGTFVIEQGGLADIERAHQYELMGGTFQIDGRLLIPEGDWGKLRLAGGRVVNNGVIEQHWTEGTGNFYNVDIVDGDGAPLDPAGFTGTGRVEKIVTQATPEQQTDRGEGQGSGADQQTPGPGQDGAQSAQGQPAPVPEPSEGLTPSGSGAVKDPPGCYCVACNCQDRNCMSPECSCDCPSCTTGVGECTCGQ